MLTKFVVFETGTRLPALDPLYYVILAWDFYRDIADDKDADFSREASILEKGLRNADAHRNYFNAPAVPSFGAESAEKVNGKTAAESLSMRTSVHFETLPTQFSSEQDYISRFYPLFLLEIKQMMHRAKEMELGSPEIVVQLSAKPRNGFILLTVQRPENFEAVLYSNDLCLIYLNNATLAQPGTTTTDSSGDSAGVSMMEDHFFLPEDPKDTHPNHILGVVENSVRDQIVIKVTLPEIDTNDTIAFSRLQRIAQCINTTGQKWCCCRIMGLSTINREYQALMSFSDLYLKDHLLLSGTDPIAQLSKSLELLAEQKRNASSLPSSQRKAQLKRLNALEAKRTRRLEFLRTLAEGETRETLEIPRQLQHSLDMLYNSSQSEALKDCLKASGITLIQGPPGTGKTTTIVGVLSVILNATVKRSSSTRAVCEVSTRDTFETLPDEDDNAEDELLLDEAHKYGECQPSEPISAADTLIKKRRENHGTQALDAPCDSEEQALVKAQPWVYQSDYVPWYDKVSLVSEDLEIFTEKRAAQTDAVVELTNVRLNSQPRRVLVCAPSNAAIDEILKRLSADPGKGGGILDANGERYTPAVVRAGPNVHPELAAYALEARTNARIQAMGVTGLSAREAVKAAVLSECSIVCSTLSICGSRELTTAGIEFDTVVIDEASQGVELSTLIPLRLGCRRLILVGDPKQLPATVFSRAAILQNYNQSLFQRLERAGHKVNMLSVQYRMHPRISAFPSQMFYDGQLADAPGIDTFVKPPIPWYTVPLFRPIVFFSLESAEASENASLINVEEAVFVGQLIDLLGAIFKFIPGYETVWHQKVGVISPYAEQVRYIRQLLKTRFQKGPNKPCPIDVSTVDGFQGQEKDFVIFSAVRAQYMDEEANGVSEKKTNVGFLADLRRMNVALTRARCNLWVVGNGRYLMGNPEWAKFWHYTEKNDFQFHVNYTKIPKEGYLKRWLHQYLKRSPEARGLLDSNVPGFVELLERDVAVVLQNELKRQAGLDIPDSAESWASVAPPITSSTAVPRIIDEGDVDEETTSFVTKP